MATTITPIIAPQNPDVTNRQIIVDGTVVLSGNYGVGGSTGDVLNLTQLGDLLKTSQLPTKVEVWEAPAAGTAPTFAQFVFSPGTTLANGLLSIAEVAGTIPAAATAYATIFAAGLPTLRVRVWAPSY